MRYQYKCQNCNCEFEIVLPVDCLATTEICCPNCHTDNVKKQFNLFALIFKGDGFYKTDSAKPLTDKE